MQPTRILPDLQCSLLCEGVRQEVNGNLFLIGVVNIIHVPQVPVVAGLLCVYNRWTAGIGQFIESIRIIAPDQTTVLRKAERRFELRDAVMPTNSVMAFGQLEFKTTGTYFIEVLVDDVMKLRYPVPVVQVPVPGQNPPLQPPEPPEENPA